MTTYLHTFTFDELDFIELTSILEKSTHHGARAMLDRLWRSSDTELASQSYFIAPKAEKMDSCGVSCGK
jgi:hypothetical protein